jgi:CRISPR-associated RAMP protein (TIGR02581 family)
MPDAQLYQYAAFDRLHNRLRITGKLVARTALRIGAGRASDVVGNDLPVLRDGRNRPFIPGASLKGAFRARLEALIRAVIPTPQLIDFDQLDALTKAINAAQKDNEIVAAIDQAINSMPRQKFVLDFEQMEARTKAIGQFKQADVTSNLSDEQISRVIWYRSSLIDLTFGSPELAGRIFFRDAPVDERFWFDTFEVRNGVAINRDTETVEGSLLYDYEVVPAGTRFDFALTLENAADWQLGMVLLALQPWQNQGVQLGGFRSRGLGYVHLEQVEQEYQQIEPENVDSALRMICDAQTLEALDIPAVATTPDVKAWYHAFRTVLTELAQENPAPEDNHA